MLSQSRRIICLSNVDTRLATCMTGTRDRWQLIRRHWPHSAGSHVRTGSRVALQLRVKQTKSNVEYFNPSRSSLVGHVFPPLPARGFVEKWKCVGQLGILGSGDHLQALQDRRVSARWPTPHATISRSDVWQIGLGSP